MNAAAAILRKNTNKIVNVASVKQLSPFRYPGGKTWLIPKLLDWVKASGTIEHFVEPFAGGASASLAVADSNLVSMITMVEKDESVAAVWKVIFSNQAHDLSEMIVSFEANPTNIHAALKSHPTNKLEQAFQVILRNRVVHGGILAPGASVMKAGENGKGITSRWYPQTLKNRIDYIRQFKDRIRFVEGDAFAIIESNKLNPRAAFFVDPPYTAGGKSAGKRLYKYNELNHRRLFELLSSVRGSVLMTYDDSEEVRRMSLEFGFSFKQVPMKGTHNLVLRELLIYKAS